MRSRFTGVAKVAADFRAECDALGPATTASRRAVRRRWSKAIRNWSGADVLALARSLLRAQDCDRWLAYELVANHPGFAELRETEIEALGRGMASWAEVDGFARILSGPAWLRGRIQDRTLARWARSRDIWWRRAALVSTVALNKRSQGGAGDVDRTLAICRPLVADQADMVVKALSWAIRELVAHDPAAVRRFVATHRNELAARVIREAGRKLTTGRKT